MRERLLPRHRAGGRTTPLSARSARRVRLARLVLGVVCAGVLLALALRRGGDSPRDAATASLSVSTAAAAVRGGPDAGRGADADARPWWAQVTRPDASSRVLFDEPSQFNGRVVVRQTGRYRSLAFLREGDDARSEAGHVQSVAAVLAPAHPTRPLSSKAGAKARVSLTELVPSYARLMLAAGLVAADAGGTGLLDGKGGGTGRTGLVAGGGAGSLASAFAAAVCAAEAPAGAPVTPAALSSASPPCPRRMRALSVEIDPVVASAAAAWFGAPAPGGGGGGGGGGDGTPLGVKAYTGDAALVVAAAPGEGAAVVFMDAMLGGGGDGSGGGGGGDGPPAPPPSHHPPAMLAPPFLAAAAAALAPGGALVANLVFTGPDPAARADAVRAWAAAAVDALSARPGTGGDARHRPAAAYVARPPPSSSAESSNLIVIVCKPTDDDAKVDGDASASTYLGGEVGAAALRRAIPRVAASVAAGAGLGDLAAILASLRPLEVGPRYGEWPLPAGRQA